MHLSGLELHGFKSFPKKTKLTFVPGVMAIVGPNGCGKTNIVDAVRWVLGEQRTSVLRSDKMENVIFAGSSGNKPMQQAEVTLLIENSHGVLPSEYSEVAITRRLLRSGESEYLINRRPSRLKDIRNLFADTGLGPDSYSIIELKMVEGILSTRPDERRRLFEEAAGVTLYKARLTSTRLKLTATRADLVRLEDVLSEITNRRNSLKRQVARAKRYRYLREALRVREITAASRELAEVRARIVPLEERVQQDRAERSQSERSLEKGEEQLGVLRGRLTVLEEQLTSQRKAREELEARTQQAQREMVMLEERLRQGLKRGEDREKEEVDLAARRVEIAREIESLDEQRREAISRVEELRLRLASLDESWSEFEKRADAVRRLRDEREEARREAEHLQVRLESEKQQLSNRLEQISRQLESLSREEGDLSSAPDPEPLRKRVATLEALAAEREGGVESSRQQREKLREERATAQNDAGKAARDVEAAKRRVTLLEGMVQGGEGRPKAVKALLQSGLKRLAGRLGDAVTAAEEDRVALAAALEDVASAIIAEDDGALREAAGYLQAQDRGRGLLIRPDRTTRAMGESPFDGREGVIAPLLDRVRAKGKAENIIRHLLDRVYLVQDLETILTLADEAAQAGWTLVARDGSRLTPDGLLAVGRKDPGDLGAAHLLEEAKGELADAETRLKEAQKRLSTLQQQEVSSQADEQKAAQDRKSVREELEKAKAELARVEADLREFETLVRRRGEEEQQLRVEMETINQRLTVLEAEAGISAKNRQGVEQAWQEMKNDLETIEEEGRSLRSARDRLREQLTEATTLQERLQGEVRRQGSLMEEIGRRLEKLGDERGDAAGALEDANERLRHVQAEDAVIQRDLENAATQLAAIQQQYEKARREYAEKDGELAERRNLQTTLSDRLHTSELEVSDLKHRLATIRERILEAYEIDLLTSKQEELPLALQDDNPFTETPLGELRDALRDIGPVNQMALEEYEVVDQRFTQLTEQHTDLVDAIGTLEETIQEINSIARERFMATFTRVEGHFVSLFSRLFGGGEAALNLADGDPLEAGIQIYASPRGKKLSSIDLLSGGEKAMTAIALLFALYLERPSPFCFLDEVDAPLDDVNVIRFNRLLREFTDRTQFLVVTHNKLTMERADRLYGVTMEQEGVSRMVAVEIGRKDREGVEP